MSAGMSVDVSKCQ